MLNQWAVSIANAYWSVHFGCPTEELFAEPFRTLTHGDKLADYRGAWALLRNRSVMISIPPDGSETLQSLLSAVSRGCSPESFAAALQSISAAVIGPAYIGYAAIVSGPVHPARALGPGDDAALGTLQRSCDPIEWEHGGSSIEQPSSGVFCGGQLVAVAGYEMWGRTIAHISVVTHPEFRGRGLGRSAVAHLASRATAAGLLPQYRTLESNRPSLRVADSLGFQRYATSIAVRLKGDI